MDSIPTYLANRRSPEKIRYKHPLLKGILDAVSYTHLREIIEPLREIADYYIDTSLMSTSTLKENVLNIFLDTPSDSMTISLSLIHISAFDLYFVPNTFPTFRPIADRIKAVSYTHLDSFSLMKSSPVDLIRPVSS